MTDETKTNSSSVMSQEKQYELMYNDMVLTLTDRKKTVFDLTRWIVTLHGLAIGFVSIKGTELGLWFIGAPLLIGVAGFSLNRSIQVELYSHRVALAKIREKVGGDFYHIHKSMVDKFLGRNLSKLGYWDFIAGSHSAIIFISTVISCLISYILIA